jgi:hypothetical protein
MVNSLLVTPVLRDANNSLCFSDKKRWKYGTWTCDV